MPTIRCEVHKYGAAESFEGTLVPTLRAVTGGVSPALTTTSTVVFGPVGSRTTVTAQAIGSQAYVAIVEGATPASESNGKWLPDGGYGIFELEAGQSLAAIACYLG